MSIYMTLIIVMFTTQIKKMVSNDLGPHSNASNFFKNDDYAIAPIKICVLISGNLNISELFCFHRMMLRVHVKQDAIFW